MPLLHIHVSGSAGTTMCLMARQQPIPRPPDCIPGPHVKCGAAGNSFNCIFGCKGPAFWDMDYGMGNLRHSHYETCSRFTRTCKEVRLKLISGGYSLIGSIEDVLDESNSNQWVNTTRRFRTSQQTSGCPNPGCCGCNQPSIFSSQNPGQWPDFGQPWNASAKGLDGKYLPGMLVVRSGEPSPYEGFWPLEGWRPLSTYCSNVRYSFLMHEPVHRMISQILLIVPDVNRTRRANWAVEVLRYIYSHDLVLDGNDKGHGFPGTAGASNYNTRMLLGPRVHFARLRALTREHHEATLQMVSRFDLVMPVRMLGHPAAMRYIAQSLEWRVMPRAVRKNAHANRREGKDEKDILGRLGDEIREHNKWDTLTYEWVLKRFVGQVEAMESVK
jgi:hypothetical protein